MKVYVLFVHKKSVSNRKICIIFIKKIKNLKNQRKTKEKLFSGFFMWFFLVFLGGTFIASPVWNSLQLLEKHYYFLEFLP
jgi:hypothetical protein